MDAQTGAISGTPTTAMTLTSYTVTAVNLAGTANTVLQIAVDTPGF